MAMAILGAWLGITVCMWFAASGSFAIVDRVLHGTNPGFTEVTKPLSPAQTRLVLRYLASEINRRYFAVYGSAQLVLGGLLFLLVVRQARRDLVGLVMIATMLGLVFVLLLFITPQIVLLGRSLDFVPRDPPPRKSSGRRAFDTPK